MNTKFFLLSFLIFASVLFAGCKSDIPVQPELTENEIHITLNPSTMLRSTRALPEREGHKLRYVLEIYKENNGELIDRVSRIIQTSPEFTVKLSSEMTYTVLAWADFTSKETGSEEELKKSDEYYLTNPLTNVRLNKEKYTLSNGARDAFSGKANNISIAQKNVALTLRRPFALMNLKEENSTVKSLRITYPAIYTAFSVQSGDVIGSLSALSATIEVLPSNDEHVLAFDYLFARPLPEGGNPQNGASLYDIKVEASDEPALASPDRRFEIQHVPFTQNYRTNILCKFITDRETGIEIDIDDQFGLPDIEGNKTFILSSYIRSSFYESSNRIPEESLLANNDLIHMVAKPYSDGSLYFELPENKASFANADYLSDFDGRDGVMHFKGANAQMNAGNDLLNGVKSFESDGTYKQFTFGTWIYIDEWTPEAYIFKKEEDDSALSWKMGAETSQLVFSINDKDLTISVPALTLGKWHHLALAYHGGKDVNNRVAIYINGKIVENTVVSADFPKAIPFIRSQFNIASGLKAKVDETFINSLYLGASAVENYMKNGIALRKTDWNSTKTLAYWKYDDASNPGKDQQSWKSIYEEVRSKIAGKNIKLRLGLMGGDWKTIMNNPVARTNFVNSVYYEIVKNKWDGVDFDFEWIYNNQDFSGYNATVIELGKKIKPLNVTFSVSLHPLAYKISPQAVDELDFISLQVYGPTPGIFSFDRFKNEAQAVLDYGFPKNKLVMGVPFYGSESNGNKATAAYLDFVQAGLITSPDADEVTYNGKTYTFNGQTTIRNKTRFVRDNKLAGVMSWDIATDVSVNDTRSLLRAVKEELNK